MQQTIQILRGVLIDGAHRGPEEKPFAVDARLAASLRACGKARFVTDEELAGDETIPPTNETIEAGTETITTPDETITLTGETESSEHEGDGDGDQGAGSESLDSQPGSSGRGSRAGRRRKARR